MKVNLKDITYYYLTTGRAANRENHMKNEFKDYNLFRVVPVSNYNRKKFFNIFSS